MSVNYASYPKITITYPTTNLSYVTVAYYGNTTATSGTVSSGNQSTGSYTSGDLSFNTLYNFTLTPYNSAGAAGTAKSITVDTTPSITGAYASNSTASNTQLQWYGTYSYVKIYRKAGTTAYVDVSAGTNLTTMPYYDKDLCGNTLYTYYIQPYGSDGTAYAASNTVAIATNVQAARDLSAVFYDTSGIMVSFTPPKNSYSSSYYYTLRASTSGVNTDVSGLTSPLIVRNLSGGTMYSCYLLTYLDGALGATSSGLAVTTSSSSSSSYTTATYYFAYTGADQTLTLPNGAVSAVVECWGAGGGSMGSGANKVGNTGYGGGGGYTQGTFSVSSYSTIKVIVGQGGQTAQNGTTLSNTYGGGGGNSNYDGNWGTSSGGGRSAVQLLVAGTYTEIVTAGGGGSAGGTITTPSSAYTFSTIYLGFGNGGAGGGSTGGNAYCYSAEGGYGGKQSAGGSGGVGGNSGSQFTGASQITYGVNYGGSGGGGYYGGGSGGLNGSPPYGLNMIFGGGGGGSSYVNTTYGTQNTMTQASGNVVAYNAGLPSSVINSIGNGSNATTTYGGATGQNGYVKITVTVAARFQL